MVNDGKCRCKWMMSTKRHLTSLRYYNHNEMLRIQNATCVASSYHFDFQSGGFRNCQQRNQFDPILTSVPKHIIAHYIFGPKSFIRCFLEQLIALLTKRKPEHKRHPKTVCCKNEPHCHWEKTINPQPLAQSLQFDTETGTKGILVLTRWGGWLCDCL